MTRVLVEEYESDLLPHLSSLKDVLEGELQKLIEGAELVIHSLNSRVKTRPSLEKKISRPDRNYQNLVDVTDLLAFRIITFYEDTISDVAKLIEGAFDVDFENSVNKLYHEDSQKFGYRSLHYICFLPQELDSKFTQEKIPFRFEIQIRTLLQHTWAEIEHSNGYKLSEQLPKELKRRFSQVASLLEVADREFVSIRTDLKNYQARLKSANFEEDQIELDQLSLLSILQRNEIFRLDREISSFIYSPLDSDFFYPDYILRVLKASGLKRTGDVLESASKWQEQFSSFLPVYFEFAKTHWQFEKESVFLVKKGYGLLFLAHLHILNTEDLFINKVNRLTQFYRDIDYPDDLPKAKNAAQALVSTLKAYKFIQE